MASLVTPLPPSPFTPPARIVSTHSHSRRTSSTFQPSNAMTPATSTLHHLHPFVHNSGGTSSSGGSPGASIGSDSDDEEDDGVPRTPGNSPFVPLPCLDVQQSKIASPTPVHTAGKGVNLSRMFDDDAAKDTEGDEIEIKPSRPADQLFNVNAKSFFPSFGDFLPSIKHHEEERRASIKAQGGIGLGLWSSSSTTTAANKENDNNVHHLIVKTSRLSFSSDTPIFSPFVQLASPETDSFTFFPSPGFRFEDGNSSGSTKPTSTSSSLLSPKPQRPSLTTQFRAPEAQHYHPHSIPPPPPPPQHYSSSIALPGFPVTPPRTPIRHSFGVEQQQQQQYQQHGYPSSASLTSTRQQTVGAYFAVPVSGASYTSSMPPALPVAVSPAPPAAVVGGVEGAYPLSPGDTDRIAKLHNGRIPTLQQLSPPEVVVGGGQPPIVNTGCQGPMVVQAGDWRCGVCAFVNWRRRKICLRCFPYANDIGNILTIQSQRAAHLAAPSHLNSPAHSSPASATFHIHPAAPPYASSSVSASGGGGGDVPSSQIAAVAMARSSTYPPTPPGSRFIGSAVGYEQGYSTATRSYTVSNPSPPPPPPSVQQQQYQYSYGPQPSTYSQQHYHQQQCSNASLSPSVHQQSQYPHSYQPQQQQYHPAPLPPIIWSDSSSPTSTSASHPHPPPLHSKWSDSSASSSSYTPSATSAGEHAALLRARRSLAAAAAVAAGRQAGGGGAGGGEGVKIFPSLSTAVSNDPAAGVDGGWGAARRNGYVAPGPGGPTFGDGGSSFGVFGGGGGWREVAEL